MNLAQIQLYIDGKNWDELAKVILDVGYDENIRFTREFLDEFLLSGKYNYAFENKRYDKVSSFFSFLFKILVLSNIELTKDDYIKIVDLAIDLNKKYNGRLALSSFLSINKHKNKEYVKLFLDQSFIEKIKSVFRNGVYHIFYFTKSHFDGLKPEEVRKLLTNINNSFSSSKISFKLADGYDESIFSAMAESPEELITLDLSKYGLHDTRYTYGSILRNLPAKKYKELFRKLLYEEAKDLRNDALDKLISLMDYHEYNNNSLKVEYTDKEIADVLSHDYNIYHILKKIAPSLTFEQAKKYSKRIDIEDLLKNKKLSIKQIGEIFTRKYIQPFPIFYYRFVREEDLLDAPHLFSPDSVLSIPSIYCSKETFSVLNKEWGKRKRWSPDLINFKKIFINNAQRNNIDEDSFFYLIQKAKPSNEEIFDAIKRANPYLKETENSEFLKNVKYILEFLEKYKQ